MSDGQMSKSIAFTSILCWWSPQNVLSDRASQADSNVFRYQRTLNAAPIILMVKSRFASKRSYFTGRSKSNSNYLVEVKIVGMFGSLALESRYQAIKFASGRLTTEESFRFWKALVFVSCNKCRRLWVILTEGRDEVVNFGIEISFNECHVNRKRVTCMRPMLNVSSKFWESFDLIHFTLQDHKQLLPLVQFTTLICQILAPQVGEGTERYLAILN